MSGSTAATPLDTTKVPTPHSSAAAANNVSIKLTTTNDTLIQALFICHNEGEAASIGMFPQYGGLGTAGIIKKLVEICKASKTGLLALDNNDAEMIGKELLKMNKLDFKKNQVINIAPLTMLVNLKDLNLNGNHTVNVAPLATLVNLTTLSLSENQILNVAPLQRRRRLLKES